MINKEIRVVDIDGHGALCVPLKDFIDIVVEQAEETDKLKEELIDMLEQFGANYALSCVENACSLLRHPRTQHLECDEKGYDTENDSCYCREVVYSKVEAKRRKKLKLNFVDKTNEM